MKNPFSLFKRDDIDLKEKWWHRLFVVLHITLLLVVAGSVAIGHFYNKEVVPEQSFNITVIKSWEAYTTVYSSGFSEAQERQYNTYRAGGMSPEDAKRLAEQPSFSSFVRQHNDKVGCFTKDDGFYTLSEYTSDDTIAELCNGDSSIVVYQENWVYHLQGIISIILLVLFWSILVQLIYYKVFLYIVFGKKLQ